jgi:chromosome segregation ATPase
MPAFDQIRRDLDDSPTNLVQWEAACLKDMASLLESLERARSEWQSLSAQLAEAKSLAAEERRVREELERVREQLAAVRREADTLRDEAGRVVFAEAAAAAALERVAELERRLGDARAHADAAEGELVRTTERFATVQRERDVLAENEQTCAELKAEAAELRTRLKRAEGARKELDEERDRAASIERELERTRKELAVSRKEAEGQMVLACDLGVQLNRLEKERDEAADRGKQKLRTTLEKVHAALDSAGAPRGDDLSFSDRIRWLATKLAERGGAAS